MGMKRLQNSQSSLEGKECGSPWTAIYMKPNSEAYAPEARVDQENGAKVASLQIASWDTDTWFVTPLLLLLLSLQSCPTLCDPTDGSHQALPSLGSSRQEHWSGLPFLSPMHASEKWMWSRSVVSDFPDPMDCSPPGSSVHGILQARLLEWVPLPSLWFVTPEALKALEEKWSFHKWWNLLRD